MNVSGRCHCGAISYDAVVDPAKVGLCHCTDCQTLTGSAYRVTVPAPAETFRLRGARPKIYVKTAESGARRAHAFCPECGSPIYSARSDGGAGVLLAPRRVSRAATRAPAGPYRPSGM